MRFLIDVDGVVADLVPYILEHLEEKFPSLDIPLIADIQSDLFSIESSPLPPEALQYTLEWLLKPGFGKNLPVSKGAQDAVSQIREAGHDVFWLTAPWWGAPMWEHDRRHWIAKNFKDGHDRVIFAHSKYVCAGSVFIDDRVKNVREWQRDNPSGKALLFTQPWNSHTKYDGYNRFTWEDTDNLLQTLEKA